MTSTIVVAVDSAESSLQALLWAARAAHDRGAALDLVHASRHPMMDPDPDPGYEQVIFHVAAVMLEDAAALVHTLWPDVDVRFHVDRKSATKSLADRSSHAALVVLGRHTAGSRAALWQSFEQDVASSSACPVVVVPRLTDERPGGVVVGVDGSESSAHTVAVAAEEAARAGADLHVVHAVGVSPERSTRAPVQRETTARALEDGRALLSRTVAQAATAWRPGPRIHRHLVHGRPAAVLLARSAHARLVVVGGHGRDAHGSAHLGPVSRVVLSDSISPVMLAGTPTRSRAGARHTTLHAAGA